MLWVRAVGHSHLVEVNHVVGRRKRVGARIFSIVGGSSSVGGLSRACGL